jgi:hypothetical protein
VRDANTRLHLTTLEVGGWFSTSVSPPLRFASEDSGTERALLFDYSSLERMKTSE